MGTWLAELAGQRALEFASENQDWISELAIDADLFVSEGTTEERNLARPSAKAVGCCWRPS